MTPEELSLLSIAVDMAQELREIVDSCAECIEDSGDPGALLATQFLLREWEAAYKLAGYRVVPIGEREEFTQ